MSSRPERRRASRVASAIEARLTEADGAPVAARIRNVSIVGLLATPARRLSVGQTYRVELLASGSSFDARALAVRGKGRELALRFEQLPYESYERLRAFLISNASDPAVIADELADRLGFLDDSAA